MFALSAPPGANKSILLAILFEHRIISNPGPVPAAASDRAVIGGVLRLAAVWREPLVSFKAAFSGFGVLFSVSFAGAYGALLYSIWGVCS